MEAPRSPIEDAEEYLRVLDQRLRDLEKAVAEFKGMAEAFEIQSQVTSNPELAIQLATYATLAQALAGALRRMIEETRKVLEHAIHIAKYLEGRLSHLEAKIAELEEAVRWR